MQVSFDGGFPVIPLPNLGSGLSRIHVVTFSLFNSFNAASCYFRNSQCKFRINLLAPGSTACASVADPGDRLGPSKEDRTDKPKGDQEEDQTRTQGRAVAFREGGCHKHDRQRRKHVAEGNGQGQQEHQAAEENSHAGKELGEAKLKEEREAGVKELLNSPEDPGAPVKDLGKVFSGKMGLEQALWKPWMLAQRKSQTQQGDHHAERCGETGKHDRLAEGERENHQEQRVDAPFKPINQVPHGQIGVLCGIREHLQLHREPPRFKRISFLINRSRRHARD